MNNPEYILDGQCSIIFAHLEALLSKEGQDLEGRASLSGECSHLGNR